MKRQQLTWIFAFIFVLPAVIFADDSKISDRFKYIHIDEAGKYDIQLNTILKTVSINEQYMLYPSEKSLIVTPSFHEVASVFVFPSDLPKVINNSFVVSCSDDTQKKPSSMAALVHSSSSKADTLLVSGDISLLSAIIPQKTYRVESFHSMGKKKRIKRFFRLQSFSDWMVFRGKSHLHYEGDNSFIVAQSNDGTILLKNDSLDISLEDQLFFRYFITADREEDEEELTIQAAITLKDQAGETYVEYSLGTADENMIFFDLSEYIGKGRCILTKAELKLVGHKTNDKLTLDSIITASKVISNNYSLEYAGSIPGELPLQIGSQWDSNHLSMTEVVVFDEKNKADWTVQLAKEYETAVPLAIIGSYDVESIPKKELYAVIHEKKKADLQQISSNKVEIQSINSSQVNHSEITFTSVLSQELPPSGAKLVSLTVSSPVSLLFKSSKEGIAQIRYIQGLITPNEEISSGYHFRKVNDLSSFFHEVMSSRSYVASLYANIFGRSADLGGLNYFTGLLDQGNIDSKNLYFELLFSKESMNKKQTIENSVDFYLPDGTSFIEIFVPENMDGSIAVDLYKLNFLDVDRSSQDASIAPEFLMIKALGETKGERNRIIEISQTQGDNSTFIKKGVSFEKGDYIVYLPENRLYSANAILLQKGNLYIAGSSTEYNTPASGGEGLVSKLLKMLVFLLLVAAASVLLYFVHRSGIIQLPAALINKLFSIKTVYLSATALLWGIAAASYSYYFEKEMDVSISLLYFLAGYALLSRYWLRDYIKKIFPSLQNRNASIYYLLALVLLIFLPGLLIIEQKIAAEHVAILVYFSLIAGVCVDFKDMLVKSGDS